MTIAMSAFNESTDDCDFRRIEITICNVDRQNRLLLLEAVEAVVRQAQKAEGHPLTDSQSTTWQNLTKYTPKPPGIDILEHRSVGVKDSTNSHHTFFVEAVNMPEHQTDRLRGNLEAAVEQTQSDINTNKGENQNG